MFAWDFTKLLSTVNYYWHNTVPPREKKSLCAIVRTPFKTKLKVRRCQEPYWFSPWPYPRVRQDLKSDIAK